MTAKIKSLIDKQDNAQIIRDLIGEILLVEVESQKVLAVAAGKDPDLWDMDIYVERSNAYEGFLNNTDNETPVVNILLDTSILNAGASNLFEVQKLTTTIHIDCLANGVSKGEGAGHLPGDYAAAVNVQRASQLVRNILMSAVYAWFDDNMASGMVGRRYIQTIEYFELESVGSVQNIKGVRFSFVVDHAETAYLYEGVPLSNINIKVNRAVDGKLILEADYPKP